METLQGTNDIIAELINEEAEARAVGNGTAGRETEAFIKNLKLPTSIITAMVNESGASIYSASEVARDEFPNEDVTVVGLSLSVAE